MGLQRGLRSATEQRLRRRAKIDKLPIRRFTYCKSCRESPETEVVADTCLSVMGRSSMDIRTKSSTTSTT